MRLNFGEHRMDLIEKLVGVSRVAKSQKSVFFLCALTAMRLCVCEL